MGHDVRTIWHPKEFTKCTYTELLSNFLQAVHAKTCIHRRIINIYLCHCLALYHFRVKLLLHLHCSIARKPYLSFVGYLKITP